MNALNNLSNLDDLIGWLQVFWDQWLPKLRKGEDSRGNLAEVCVALHASAYKMQIIDRPLDRSELPDAESIAEAVNRLLAIARVAKRSEEEAIAGKQPQACWIGNGRVRVGSETITLESQYADVLQALVEMQSATKPELQKRSGRDQPDKVLKKLVNRYPQLKPFIRFPGARGRGGYGTTIIQSDS